MKKKFIIYSLCLFSFFIPTYANDITKIKNWEKYKITINRYVNTVSDKQKLELLIDKLNNLDISKIKNSHKKNDLKVIIEYFKYVLTNKLEEINLDSVTENNSNVNNDTQLMDYNNLSKSDLYPWFSLDYNDSKKSILAGEKSFVFDAWVVAMIEPVEVEKIEFIFETSDTTNLKYWLWNLTLFVEWQQIWIAKSNNIKVLNSTQAKVIFNSLENFIVPKQQIELRLMIEPVSIWYEKNGKYIPEITIKSVEITQATWLISNKATDRVILNEKSEYFQILPVWIKVDMIKNLRNDSIIEFSINTDTWINTNTTSANDLKTSIKSLSFLYRDTSWNSEFYIYNSRKSSLKVKWVKNWDYLYFDTQSLENVLSWNWSNKFSIQIVNWVNTLVWLELLNDWIEVWFDIPWYGDTKYYLQESLDFGTKAY